MIKARVSDYKGFLKSVSSVLHEDMVKSDEEFDRGIIRLFVESGKNEVSIKLTSELFFSTLYSNKTPEQRYLKHREIVQFLQDQEQSNQFYRLVYMIRQKNLKTLQSRLNIFLHSLIESSLKNQDIFDSSISQILSINQIKRIDKTFNTPLQKDLKSAADLQNVLKKANAKSIIKDIDSKLNQNPLIKIDKWNQGFVSECWFQIIKHNKWGLEPVILEGKGSGPSKIEAEREAIKVVLLRLMKIDPEVFERTTVAK